MNDELEIDPRDSAPNLSSKENCFDWCLRFTVLMTCLGIGGRYVFSAHETESDVYGWLFFDCGWKESLALSIDNFGALATLLSGCLLLVNGWTTRRQRSIKRRASLLRLADQLAAGWIAFWLLMIALSKMIRTSDYPHLVLAEHAVRYAAPLALIFISGHRFAIASKSSGIASRKIAIWILVIAASTTFAAHGYKAFERFGPFADLILLSDLRWTQIGISQSVVEQWLMAIGIVDLLVACLLWILRSRLAALYMACWGFVTAASRMTAFGWEAWPETMIRFANGAVPLAILLYWTPVVLDLGSAERKNNFKESDGNMNRTAKLLVTAGCFALAFWLRGGLAANADAPLEGTSPAQWRLIWTSDPSTTATVSWSTAAKGDKHSVRYRVKDGDGPDSETIAESGRYTGGSLELHYHHVRLTGLEPSTAYEVQMVSDTDKSPVFYFVTAPSSDRDFSILNGGDSRSDQDARRRMNQVMSKMVEESYGNDDLSDDILALAHGGDYIVSGKQIKLWSMWLSDHELTTGSDGRLLPIIPARGNHDKGDLFNQVFGFPEEDLNYYGISIGPQVRFVTLSTETSTAGDQANWLADELRRSRASHRWLLAQYHRPAFPAVKSPSAALISWVPLFEKFDVDLVCEADGHNIKRTVPIRGGKYDETGVVYVGEGGLGVPQRTPKPERWFLQSPGMTDKGHHVFVITFRSSKIHGKCVLEDGTVRDEFARDVRAKLVPAETP